MIHILCLDLLRDDHELLESEAATSVGTTVEHVLEGNRQDIGLLGSGKIGDVGIEGNALLGRTSLGDSQADTEDGIGTQVGLVGRSIQLDEEFIDLALVLDVNVLLDDGRSNDLVDVLNGLQDTYSTTLVSVDFLWIPSSYLPRLTLSTPLGLISITQLVSLVLACQVHPSAYVKEACPRG